MSISCIDVAWAFRKLNILSSPHSKYPRRLATRLSAFESSIGSPVFWMAFPNTLSYCTIDAPRFFLFHDISLEALLECGMTRSGNDPRFYYQLRGEWVCTSC